MTFRAATPLIFLFVKSTSIQPKTRKAYVTTSGREIRVICWYLFAVPLHCDHVPRAVEYLLHPLRRIGVRLSKKNPRVKQPLPAPLVLLLPSLETRDGQYRRDGRQLQNQASKQVSKQKLKSASLIGCTAFFVFFCGGKTRKRGARQIAP